MQRDGSKAVVKPLEFSGLRFRRAVSGQVVRETAYRWFCFACAFLSVLTTFGIIYILGKETVLFFQSGVSPVEFFTSTKWSPTFADAHFGVLPLLNGTLMITLGAALIALPLGLASAIYLSIYASARVRSILKPILEVLAGVPTVVYGFFALFHVTPFLQKLFPSVQVYNAASGCIVVGIMILPLVTSLCDDALSAVPRSLREGGVAMGSTTFETVRKILVPAALSGIMASFILAVSRAVGETMAVTLAAGAYPRMTVNPAESIQTMTAFIVQISKGDTPAGSTAYLTLFAVGATLFVITMGLNIIARKIVRRYRLVM